MHKFSENWMLRVLLWSENVISFTNLNEMELWQGIFLHRTSAKNWFEHLITSIKSFKMLDLLHFGRSKSSGFFATLLVPERSMHWKKVPRTNEEHDFEAICTEVGTLIGGPTFVLWLWNVVRKCFVYLIFTMNNSSFSIALLLIVAHSPFTKMISNSEQTSNSFLSNSLQSRTE